MQASNQQGRSKLTLPVDRLGLTKYSLCAGLARNREDRKRKLPDKDVDITSSLVTPYLMDLIRKSTSLTGESTLQTGRQTDRETNRQTDRQTDRQLTGPEKYPTTNNIYRDLPRAKRKKYFNEKPT